MKKIIIPVLVLALLGGGWYFMKGSGDLPGIGSSMKEDAFTGGLMAAVKLGVPMKCSYTVGDQVESEGYIKGKRYRGKMTAEKGRVAEVIMKDECMWNWDTDTKEGIMFCFDENSDDTMWDFDEEGSDDINEDSMRAPDGFEAPDVEYNCLPAIVSDAMFTPPSDVEFVDMAAMFDSFMPDDVDGMEGTDSMDSNVDIEKLMEQYGQ